MASQQIWIGVALAFLICVFSGAVSAQSDEADIPKWKDAICGGKYAVQLTSEHLVACWRIEELLTKIQNGKKPKEFNKLDIVIMEAIFPILQKKGFTFKIDEEANTWIGMYEYILLSDNKGAKSDGPDASEVFAKVCGSKETEDLYNGKIVYCWRIDNLLKAIQEGNKLFNLNQLDEDILQSLVISLHKQGYKLNINEQVNSWQGFYVFLFLSGNKEK